MITINAIDIGPVGTFEAVEGTLDSVFSSQSAFTAKSAYVAAPGERWIV